MGTMALGAPLLAGGPPGWLAYAALGVVTLGAGVYIYATSSDSAETKTRTNTKTETATGSCRPYTCRIHAQGTDCGGTTSSTIGSPPIVKSVPITIAEGLALSNATFAMLNKSQQKVRITAKAKAERYIQNHPPVNTQKSFPALDRSGGKRYDVDNYGCSPNFIS